MGFPSGLTIVTVIETNDGVAAVGVVVGVEVGVVVVVDLVLLVVDDEPEDLVEPDEPELGGVDGGGVVATLDKVKLAVGKTPFQTLVPLLLSISEPDVMATGALPLARTLKVIWATGWVPLTTVVEAQPILTDPLPPVCWPQSVKGPFKLIL